MQIVKNGELPAAHKFIGKNVGDKLNLPEELRFELAPSSTSTTALFVLAPSAPYTYQKRSEVILVTL